MPRRRRIAHSRLVAALLLVGAACTGNGEVGRASGSGTEAGLTPSTSVPSSPSSSASPSPVIDASGRALIRSPAGGSFLVHGKYPFEDSPCKDHEQPRLVARYPGALAVRHDEGGTLSLTITLSFEDYLRGIAEVPPSWPSAALDAQAVAARSYALATTGWDGEQGETLPTPICATTACQVYRGIPVEPVQGIGRWYAAVARTRGSVLLSDGRPADAVYFSTSNGRTYGNEDVFGSSPLPYLRPVVERDDGASPTSRWQVRIWFRDLATFLARAGEWPEGGRISAIDGDGSSVTVTGGDGVQRVIDGSAFRDAVNEWAPCLRPGRYPTDGLPLTIPSRWMSATSAGAAAAMIGRGWGHGVGMVQWGAYGKAVRGWPPERILAFYYGDLRPEPYPEPGLIHVQVASGLTTIRLLASGPGATIDGLALGSGSLVLTGGEALTVRGPALGG